MNASLSPRTFRALLLTLGVVTALPFFWGVRRPLALIPCGAPPLPCRLGDSAIGTSVLGRAWARFERGEPWNRDDRVFAPYPDSWALSEGYLVEAIVGYPWARLTGSPAAGYNVAFALACVLTFWSAGALFLRLAGPGWPALLGAFLFTWSQGRLNGLSALTVLWAGLVPLAIAFGLDVLRLGRARDALLFGAAWLAVGMGSLYGLLMGSIAAGFVLAACGLFEPARRNRLPLLLAAGAAAALPLFLVHRPLLTAARDFDVKVSARTFEGQSADLASLLHHSGFSVPLKAVFDRLLPGFPPGAPGFFPGLLALAAAALWVVVWIRQPRALRQGFFKIDPARPESDLRLWGGLAVLTFLFALGPTIHLLGRPLLPGPWRLLTHVPVFSSMRGLFRWDQWFFLAVAACIALALTAAARDSRPSTPARAVACALVGLLLVDVWPRPVVGAVVPGPSPFQDELRALDRDAIVAVYPFERATSERAWIEQLFHGRRVLNGFQSFPTPVHLWLDAVSHTRPPDETLAIYRELGASAIEVDLAAERRRETLEACAAMGAREGVREIARGGRLLFLAPPLAPVLVDPLALRGLSFAGAVARLAGPPGRLVFRLRAAALPVRIESPVTNESRERSLQSVLPSVLRIPLVGEGGLEVRLDDVPAPGARILAAAGGAVLGSVRPAP